MNYYRNKTVLVTGGAGFIGSHLIDQLVAFGSDITVLDNFKTGSRLNVTNPAVKIIDGDVGTHKLPTADVIFNLACPASPVHYQADPIGTWKSSVLGAMNVAEAALISKARVIHASTSEVYGDPLQHPQTEGYWGNVNPNGARACYDEGKRAAEAILMDFHRIHNLDVRLPRLFNTYGPRMAHNDGRVVTNFITQALAGEDITVFGDGSYTRSFCYVSDMVDALLRFGATDGLDGEVINLGNPNEFTIIELAQKTIALTESTSQICFKELPPDDPQKRQPDISKAKDMLDWSPRVQLAEGLATTIESYADANNFTRQIVSSM